MLRLNVRLFGKFQAHRGDEVIKGLDIRKVQELLCYLLLNRNHAYPREMLAGLLWGDTSVAQAKKCMRPGALAASPILDADERGWRPDNPSVCSIYSSTERYS